MCPGAKVTARENTGGVIIDEGKLGVGAAMPGDPIPGIGPKSQNPLTTGKLPSAEEQLTRPPADAVPDDHAERLR